MRIYKALEKFYQNVYDSIFKYPTLYDMNDIQRCAGACGFAVELTSSEEEKQSIIELWDNKWRTEMLIKLCRWDLI